MSTEEEVEEEKLGMYICTHNKVSKEYKKRTERKREIGAAQKKNEIVEKSQEH